MLRVTVELVPFGLETMKKAILTTTIANVGKAGPDSYNYYYSLTGETWQGKSPDAEGDILNHDRNQPLVNLLAEVFKDAGLTQGT